MRLDASDKLIFSTMNHLFGDFPTASRAVYKHEMESERSFTSVVEQTRAAVRATPDGFLLSEEGLLRLQTALRSTVEPTELLQVVGDLVKLTSHFAEGNHPAAGQLLRVLAGHRGPLAAIAQAH